MITKHHRGGKSVRKLLEYCLRKDQDPEIVGGTMAGQDARSLAREFAASRAAAAHLAHPVMHWSISYQQADIEAGLTPERRGDIARDLLRRHLDDDWNKVNAQRIKRGLEPTPKPDVDRWDFVVVSHRAADSKMNPHDHLVAIRANPDGHVYHARHSHRAAPGIDRAVEQDFGLVPLPERSQSRSRQSIRPTDHSGYIAQQRNEVTGKDVVAHEARLIWDRLKPDQRSLDVFASALAECDLSLFRERTERGRVRFYIGTQAGERWRSDRLGFRGETALDHLESPPEPPVPVRPHYQRDR